MHYYERNLGDYYKKAGRLSILQHGAYTLLIDACYDREKFPTLEEALDWAWAESDEEVAAVKLVLRKFFKIDDSGVYVHQDIAADIEAYQDFLDKQSENGKKGGRPPKQKPTGNPLETQNNPLETQNNPNKANESLNQEPLTTNQEPILKKEKSAGEEKTESNLYVVPSRRTYEMFIGWKPEHETWIQTLQVSQHLVKPDQFTDYTLAEFIRSNIGKDEKTENDWQRFYVNAIARGYITPEGQAKQQAKQAQHPKQQPQHDEYITPPLWSPKPSEVINPATDEQVKEIMDKLRRDMGVTK